MLENTLCVHANVKTSRRQCANGWKRCDFDNHRNASLLFGGAVRAGHLIRRSAVFFFSWFHFAVRRSYVLCLDRVEKNCVQMGYIRRWTYSRMYVNRSFCRSHELLCTLLV